MQTVSRIKKKKRTGKVLTETSESYQSDVKTMNESSNWGERGNNNTLST